MDQLQWYPTPPELAEKAWSLFKNRDFLRVLEPSAGRGDLALTNPWKGDFYRHRHVPIDCVEIDIEKHATLRKNGLNVVGFDFMQFEQGSIYSHIICNPPFSVGVHHVLKAWEIAFDAEIVAIINAETIKNPFSKERQLLCRLIEQHGSVEFIDGAFAVPEAERKTEVEIALVYLRKAAPISEEIFGDLLSELRKDEETGCGLAGDFKEENNLALANSVVENMVLTFKASVRAMKDSVYAEGRAMHYAALLGRTMAEHNSGAECLPHNMAKWVRKEIEERYLSLKDRAWTGLLRSTQVLSKLSSSAQKLVESQFAEIKTLEFTVANIYGFMSGLANSQGEIQKEMILGCFDLILKYHENNTVFYKGWVSNGKHRSCGMRIKHTRFVLPGFGTEGYQRSLSWEAERRLSDFDKVTAMLNGVVEPEVSLVQIFRERFNDLRSGMRVSASYFDVRYYPGTAGTIHFFPRGEWIDRLNRYVGRLRKWLPEESSRVSEDFWKQYEKAEQFDKSIRAEINERSRFKSHWQHPLNRMFSSDQAEHQAALEAIDDAVTAVLEKNGINVHFQLENKEELQQLPLLVA